MNLPLQEKVRKGEEKMIESNMGTVKIAGEAVVIVAELECAITEIISGMIDAGMKKEDAWEMVDEIVEDAKKTAKMIGNNATHRKTNPEEDGINGLLELLEKILKDISEE